MMPDLLLEIGTEEMPPLEVPRLASQLLEGAQRTLAQAHLPYRKVEVLYALRRLALVVRDLAPDQEESYEVVKGPQAAVAFDRSGRPTQAAVGFAKSQGVTVDAITQATEGGRSYAVIRRSVPGRRTIEILPEILPPLVKQLHPSKSMRWDSSGLTFIRPIRWLVCLYGDEVIPVTLGTLRASRVSRGHRFLNPDEITLASASEYETALAGALVIVDAKAREETVMEGLKEAARELGGEILIDAELLGWIANGAEHPTPVLGRVPPRVPRPPGGGRAGHAAGGKVCPICPPRWNEPVLHGVPRRAPR
jgi:glycyl-tRNA synthetase beta subunit